MIDPFSPQAILEKVKAKIAPYIPTPAQMANKYITPFYPTPTGAPIPKPKTDTTFIKNFESALPEQLVRGFGLGSLLDIPQAAKDLKASGNKVSFSDIGAGVKETGQGLAQLATNVITKPAVGAVEYFTGQKNLAPKLPVLGTITSPQQDVEEMVAQGIPRWQAITQVAADQAVSGGAFVEGGEKGAKGAEIVKNRAVETYKNTNPESGFAKIPFRGDETPQEILKKAEEDAAKRHPNNTVKPEVVFRGGDKPFDKKLIGNEGVFVTPSKFMASTFGKNIDKFNISPNAKILTYDKLPNEFKNLSWDEAATKISKYAKENGYDVVDSLPPNADYPRGMERHVINPEVLKLKKLKYSDEGIPLAKIVNRNTVLPESRSILQDSMGTERLPELPQEAIPPRSRSQNNQRIPSNNDTTNKVDFKITGDTEKQKVQSAITNSERIKNELSIRGKDAYVDGRSLSPHDIKLAEDYEKGIATVADLVKQANDPVKFGNFMNKMIDYYDFRLAADRAAGGKTGFVSNYIPHMWDLGNPGDLARFNNLAMQKGLQPYDGFRSQPRVFGTYAEGEALGFKRANPNIVADLKNDYGAASNAISKQVLKQGLKQAAPKNVTTKGFGRTEKGKPFVNSNIPGLEGMSYHPNIDGMLKGFEKLNNKDFIKIAQEEATLNRTPGLKGTLKQIPASAKEAGFTGIVGTLYDHANKPMKELMLNFSGFHSINISANFAGASIMNPIKGVSALVKSIPSFFSETVTKGIIDGYKNKKIPGRDMSVFDAGLRSGVNMDREIPAFGKQRLNIFKSLSRAMFDRELHTLKLNLVDQVFGDGKIDPESPKGRAYGKEINMIMGEMNNHTMNINPNTQKWLSRVLLAPHFTESKYLVLKDAFRGKENAGNLARKAVIGKSIVLGTLSTLGTLLATGNFPNLKQLLLNYTIDPNIQTNLTNPKGQKQDIGLPKSFISEPVSLFEDPIHYGEARLAPALSDAIAGVTNKDYYGNTIVDPNSKDSVTSQIIKNVGVGDLPIGAQNIVKQREGKQTVTQTAINILGLRTHISKDDPTAIYYKQISDAKDDISDIGGGDPDRTAKIQAIYNTLTPEQRKSLNYQELLAGISTKGVLSGDAGKMKPLYDKLQVMKANGQTEEANKIWSELSPADKALYKKVKVYYKKADTSQAEKDFQSTFESIRALKTSGDPALEAQADTQYNALSAEERRIYQLLKKQNL